MKDHDLKILILGYKIFRRGATLYETQAPNITACQLMLYQYLPRIIEENWFKVVSFDNLAIKQLHVQEHLPEEQWEEFYMGDDSEFTFYIDMVDGTFGKNSLATERYPIMDNIDDMLNKIKGE